MTTRRNPLKGKRAGPACTKQAGCPCQKCQQERDQTAAQAARLSHRIEGPHEPTRNCFCQPCNSHFIEEMYPRRET